MAACWSDGYERDCGTSLAIGAGVLYAPKAAANDEKATTIAVDVHARAIAVRIAAA